MILHKNQAKSRMEIEKDGTDNAEPKYNIDYLVNLMYYDL
jgi:hypothetical protein